LVKEKGMNLTINETAAHILLKSFDFALQVDFVQFQSYFEKPFSQSPVQSTRISFKILTGF